MKDEVQRQKSDDDGGRAGSGGGYESKSDRESKADGVHRRRRGLRKGRSHYIAV